MPEMLHKIVLLFQMEMQAKNDLIRLVGSEGQSGPPSTMGRGWEAAGGILDAFSSVGGHNFRHSVENPISD
jgi:hypothetical protein